VQHHTTRARLLSRRRPDHTVIAILGELDVATTADLRNRILTAMNHTTTRMIIDLSGVSFCDASGLAVLVGAQRRAGLRGLTLSLAAPPPLLKRILGITGLNRAFTIHPTVASAQIGAGRSLHPAVA
jgi:anti-anti-sigma factor